mmetsp:Transcript_56553/g.111716  ORF Transcript_56553/g.111716 Transcript_56553/m.111716 type:complete len:94 (+) Transcript_56553:650-931(+)
MCRPGGCTKWVLTRSALGDLLTHHVGEYDASMTTAAVVIPLMLLEYECRHTKTAALSTTTSCGCLDMGTRVLHRETIPTEKSMLCLLEKSNSR